MLIFFLIVFSIYFLANFYIFIKGFRAIPEGGSLRLIYSIVFIILASTFIAGKFLEREGEVDSFLSVFLKQIEVRLHGFYQGMLSLRAEGYRVDVIAPQAAIYLTVQFDLIGMKTSSGKVIQTTQDITDFLCDEAGLAIVPFSSFGSATNGTWYRLSVGVAKEESIPVIIELLRNALGTLS